MRSQAELGSFDAYIWDFVDGKPLQNRWRSQSEVPATSPVSDALSKDLKKRGFRFVGSTTLYAHLQATGLINDHLRELLPPRGVPEAGLIRARCRRPPGERLERVPVSSRRLRGGLREGGPPGLNPDTAPYFSFRSSVRADSAGLCDSFVSCPGGPANLRR